MTILYIDAENITVVDGFGDSVPLKTNHDMSEYGFDVRFTALEGYTILNVTRNIDGDVVEIDVGDGLVVEDNRVGVFANKVTYTIQVEGSETDSKELGYNNVYLVTNSDLKNLFKEQFEYPNAVPPMDLTNYIINLLELPFKISESYYKGIEPIRFETYNMETEVQSLNNDVVVFDFGSVSIPSIYNNALDLVDTKTIIHLPYSNPIELDVNYVVGYEISVIYLVDLYSGDTSINISSSRINKVIETNSVNITRELPFLNKNKVVKELGNYRGVNNGVVVPYIEVIRNKKPPVSKFSSEVVRFGNLIDVEGFVTVKNIQLESNISLEDERKILNLLNEGVFIK